MRTLLVALMLLTGMLALPAPADDARVIALKVGEVKPLAGYRPLCDDPGIVSLVGGVIEGLKVGETTCSLSQGSPLGARQVYRVIVGQASKSSKGDAGVSGG